jgi:hypothetical protein
MRLVIFSSYVRAFLPYDIGKSRLDGMHDNLVCPNGGVVQIPSVRSFRAVYVAVVERIVAMAISSAASAIAE